MARPGTGERLAFVVLVAAALVPVWIVAYFPSQDGPSHLETGNILLRHGDASWAIYREYYEIEPRFGTNLLVPLALGALSWVFSFATAEKLLVSGYIVLLAGSMRFALASIAAENRWLSVVGLLLAYTFHLHMGFWNYCYSVALFPLVVGYFLRHHPGWTASSTIRFALLALLLHFLHPVSLFMAIASIAILVLWPWRGWRATLLAAGAFLPPVVHLVLFATREGNPALAGAPPPAPIRLEDFAFLASFLPFDRFFPSGVVALLGAGVAYRLASWRPERQWNRLLGLVAAAVITYALAPDELAGGGMIKGRLPIYAFIGVVLWLGAGRYPRWFRAGFVAAAVILLALQIGFYSKRYRAMNQLLAEIHSGNAFIEPGSTILPFMFDATGIDSAGRRLAGRNHPFLHAASRVALERRSVNLFHYQGDADFFPVAYRRSLNPYANITLYETWYDEVPPFDFLGYPWRTRGRIDYVLVWDMNARYLAAPSVRYIALQLAVGFDRIFVSPTGRMQLYRHKARRAGQ